MLYINDELLVLSQLQLKLVIPSVLKNSSKNASWSKLSPSSLELFRSLVP